MLFTFGFLLLALICQVATANPKTLTFGDYVAVCYNMGEYGIASTSAGGLFTGMLAYLICSILTDVGSYVVLGIAISFIGYFLIKDFVKEPNGARRQSSSKFKSSFVKEEIDENLFAKNLYLKGAPDPDLVIRTGGEFRLSNYLLWQAAYSEFYVTDTLWPDFDRETLNECIEKFYSRRRRYGGL